MSAATRPEAAFSLVELLVALGVGMGLAIVGVAALATALRHLAAFAVRAEADDIALLAAEAFMLDVRRAGYDPQATGVEPLFEATTTRLGMQADVDGDGVIDATSAEQTIFACDLPGGRLSRIIGSQSLPLANGVVRCALGYVDEAGATVAVPPAGLDAAARRRIRAATLDVALVPPGLGTPSVAQATVALRVQP
jgi:type II secretory pathway pseudopilin PulG